MKNARIKKENKAISTNINKSTTKVADTEFKILIFILSKFNTALPIINEVTKIRMNAASSKNK